MTPASVTFLVVGALVVLVMFRVLRSGRLREKYAALWLVVGVAGVLVAVWPDLLTSLTRVLGFQLPANLLFFLTLLLLLGVCLHLSLEASNLESETRTLAEEVALLHARLDELTRPQEPGPHSDDDGTIQSRGDVAAP